MGVCASNSAALFAKLYAVDESTVLCQGSYATIFQGRSKRSGDAVVVKRIDKAAVAAESLGKFWEDETATLQQCTPHANIIGLLRVYESPTHVYIVTEQAPGGELFNALISEGAYSEWDAKRFTRDIFEALARIHDEQIVHRDIKPENLLLSSTDPKKAHIKLSDFGSAMPVNGTSQFSCSQLTWAYCAPEVLREALALQQLDDPSIASSVEGTVKPKVPNPSASPKSDVWSVGIVLYVLLSGVHPFDPDGRQTKDQIISGILHGDYSLTEPPLWESEISSEAKSLLRLLLSADPMQRPTARKALTHGWFKDATTPRQALGVSTSNGLGAYQRMMRKKFRTSVMVAMAAQTLRRSLERLRTSNTNSSRLSVGLDDAASVVVSSEDPTAVPKVGNDEAPALDRGTAAARKPNDGQDESPVGDASSVEVMAVQMSRVTSKLFGSRDREKDATHSEQPSIDLIDEFDGDANANATRPAKLVD